VRQLLWNTNQLMQLWGIKGHSDIMAHFCSIEMRHAGLETLNV
jgi:hypothetical protein